MRRDDSYLLDILLAARQALKFMEGVNRNEFEEDDMLQSAVIRPLEIIGEASARLTDTFRKSHPEIAWNEMIGMRNRLIHEYFRVNATAVWDTIHDDLPILVQQIEPLVPKEDEI
ncbi:MAG: DUF86 domain-containing protein [Anaerolineales bacterium]|nr:MAG: DUF86 domain-containing protein [Anaerolineales bacterium]